MGTEYAVLLINLKKRFDDCFDEYNKELLELKADRLIELASEIVAIKETYYEIRFWIELSMCKAVWPNNLIDRPIAKQDVATLLSLRNPLKELGQKWWFYTFGNKVDFHCFFKAITEVKQ